MWARRRGANEWQVVWLEDTANWAGPLGGFMGSEGLYLPMLGNTENGKASDEGDFHVMEALHEPRLAKMNKSRWTSLRSPAAGRRRSGQA